VGPQITGLSRILLIIHRLKCDRNLPCENCMKRELASSCTYVHQGVRNASSQVQKPGGGSKDVRERVQHLERLVIDLMDKITQQELSLVPNKPCEPGLRILDRSSNGTFGSAAGSYSELLYAQLCELAIIEMPHTFQTYLYSVGRCSVDFGPLLHILISRPLARLVFQE
jgi:hypothetical protein